MTDNGGSGRIEIVKALMRAWSAHDVEGVVALVSDDVEWHYAVGQPPVHGKEHMAKFLSRLSKHQLQLAWRLVHHAENGDVLLVEGVDDYVNPSGNRVQVPYMGAYEFDGNTVTHWRDYVDMTSMQNAEKGDAVPDYLVPLVEAGETV
ncbi:MAG: limonene-1,2-epoxide hydrolase [Candidatus Poriferisodalaceae bacterium]|jgi:limonene-1,2-epoxide hydrolase